jgi:membrane fusion protein, adhesin transport system
MLNISNEIVTIKSELKTLDLVQGKQSGKVLLKLLIITFSLVTVALFLPWTQNVRGKGNVTTLFPDQRPQTINTILGGKVEKWYVREGDYVEKGDTIVFISEIKDDYFDPNLVQNTDDQLKAKESSVRSYMSKIQALDVQIDALTQTGRLKLEQAKNKLIQSNLKVTADSMNYHAAKINYDIASEQFNRAKKMNTDGLMSLTEFENRKLTMQRTEAQKIAAENQLLSSRNEVLNAQVELISLQAQFRSAISKAESDKFSTMSNMFDAEGMVTKLQNQFVNYSIRSGYYYITAPQNGIVTNFISSGIGEIVKEGEEMLTIMPAYINLAVEMYVRPIDLPLIKINHRVRIQFDGWPAIVFSGWPNASYGTYGGRVFAIDNFISENGFYRVLIQPDPGQPEWPDALRVGAGTYSMLLLNDVPIWYELWRQLNGFPPDYYQGTSHKDMIETKKNKKK